MQRIKVTIGQLRSMKKKNDRYAIYSLLKKKVSFRYKLRKVQGMVTEVVRDIFEDCIRLTIGSKDYEFDEPSLIFVDDGHVVFIYGQVDGSDMTDDELFKEFRESGFSGETMEDVMKRTDKEALKQLRFKIME